MFKPHAWLADVGVVGVPGGEMDLAEWFDDGESEEPRVMARDPWRECCPVGMGF
jgi:hypothetical protein